jgi:AbrB family looped-hinge helix DNA binding protein
LCIYTHYSQRSSFAKLVSTRYSPAALQTKTLGDKMPDSAALSTRFRLYIPKRIRAAANWKAGQKLAFIPKGKGVLLMPVPNLEELRGIAKGANPQDCLDRQDRF